MCWSSRAHDRRTGRRRRRPAETRYRLALAAFADEPRVEVSRLELDRPGPSYTVDTLERLAGPGQELYLILGADQLAALGSWHRPDRVRELARVAVAARPGAPHADDAEELVMQPVDAASSELRRSVAEGIDVSDLVPAGGGRGDRARGAVPPDPVLG